MNAVTATEETNLIVPTATGEAKPILNPTKTAITKEIDIMMTWDLETVGGHEDTTAVLGTDRVTEGTTMVLGTDRATVGTVDSTATDRGEETSVLLTAGETIATESVTEEKDSGADGIMVIETGIESEKENHRRLHYRHKPY